MTHSTENARRFAEVYDELRQIAKKYYFENPADYTLQPTALVNEAWLKLADQHVVPAGGREHFLSVASRAMRRILVDHARKRAREKRGGSRERVTLQGVPAAEAGEAAYGLDELDEALEALAAVSERQARIVELRFFGGLGEEDSARVLGLSVTTLQREWRIARAWLGSRLEGR